MHAVNSKQSRTCFSHILTKRVRISPCPRERKSQQLMETQRKSLKEDHQDYLQNRHQLSLIQNPKRQQRKGRRSMIRKKTKRPR